MNNWKTALHRSLLRPDSAPRVAVVGVGQTLRGDDGAGVQVARHLARRCDDATLLVVEAEHAPENCLGLISRFQPDVVLFVDAARGRGAPGDIVWLEAEEADGAGGSTHTLPLAMLGEYLIATTGAAVYVLGISPGEMAFGTGLSDPVARAVSEVIETLAGYWRTAATAASAMAAGGASVVST